jgi:hypothetical protein
MTKFHQSVLIEFPILIAMGSEPLSLLVVVFVTESYGDAIFGMCPDLLDKAIIAFYTPFIAKKSGNFVSSVQKLRPIAPHSILGVRHFDL